MAKVERSSGDRGEELPVDARLIMPETRYEVLDGEVMEVPPRDQPHGSRHSKLSALLEAYASDEHDAACDMLTRTSELNDFAPDGSIYPIAPHPTTGGRQIEELAFEVVSTETLAHAIAQSKAFSIAGGGDTLAAVDKYGIAGDVSYISTGGGAFLEFLEGKTLPAVAALEARGA